MLPEGTGLLDDEHENSEAPARVNVLPFTRATYGRFIPALNAIIAFAHVKGFEHVLFQSVEVKIDPDSVKKMTELCHAGKFYFSERRALLTISC